MTFQDRVQALVPLGLTARQAGFLTTVMLHSGVCLARQYCAYSRIARGQKMHDFFKALVVHRFATVYPHAHGKTHLYHVHAKPLYEAIGQANNRHRKSVTLTRAIERLMVLDAVLMAPELNWLATEHEKVTYFIRHTRLRLEELPHLTFGSGPPVRRSFPDKLPIGTSADGRTHVFVYVATRSLPIDFRAFLHSHTELFRALPSWTIRVLLPPHLAAVQTLYRAAAREELATPLRPDTRDELRRYFECRRQAPTDMDTRYRRAQRAFGAPRFQRLYRSWLESGDAVVDGMVSPVLADALARGSAQVECHVLPHQYQYLSSLVGTS